MTYHCSLHQLARLRGFEPPAYGLEVRSSIQLSYRRLISNYTTFLIFGQGQIGFQTSICEKII